MEVFAQLQKNTQEAIKTEVSKTKRWGFNCVRPSTIDKTWNHGVGSLELIRFDVDHKLIIINSSLWNAADQRHLDNILKAAPELGEYRTIRIQFGYPHYYRYSLGIHFAATFPDLVENKDKKLFQQIVDEFGL